MTKKYYSILVLFVSVFASAVYAQVVIDNLKVARILDGKTVLLQRGAIVQYIGVDVSEADSSGIMFINEKLLTGKTISLEFDTLMQDEQGRLQAYVYIDSLSVNGYLIRFGFAGVAYEALNNRYQENLMLLEKLARQERLGIWAEHEVSAMK